MCSSYTLQGLLYFFMTEAFTLMELSSQFYGPQLKGQQEAAIERRSQDFTDAAAKSVQIGDKLFVQVVCVVPMLR